MFEDAFASFRALIFFAAFTLRTSGLAYLPCRLFYMQLVTPRVVATAVRMLMITCISVFHVSLFIMIFLSFSG